MAQFVAISAQKIEEHLTARGFTRSVQRQEVTYVRFSERRPDVCVKVYTSVKIGASTVRAAGKDAIRVCAVFDNGRRSFGIGKFPPVMRVHSEASILQRLDERIDDAVERVIEWMDQEDARTPVPTPVPTRSNSGYLGELSFRRIKPAPTPEPEVALESAQEPPQDYFISDAMRERIEEKNEFARLEWESEQRGFMSDPDMRREIEAEYRAESLAS